jgi:hypothetical protein
MYRRSALLSCCAQLRKRVSSRTMAELNFRKLALVGVPAPEWLQIWSARYTGYDDETYFDLVKLAQRNALTTEDYVRMGKWKDGVGEDQPGKWRPNVASVAYEIWIEISRNEPKWLEGGEIEFLDYWSERTYTDTYPSSSVNKRFGLSRATTLLHFVSGGRYPIFDSNVRKALIRLGHSRPKESVVYYLETYVPLFQQILDLCQSTDARNLDKALFSYGASAAYQAAQSE